MLLRTSPEEFLQRLSIVEENHKVSESSTNDVKGRDFSMPTPPKSAVKVGTQPSMMRDKVRKRQFWPMSDTNIIFSETRGNYEDGVARRQK